MRSDAAFARAAVPAPTKVLNLPLRPYAVGHALWLEALGNPLAGECEGATAAQIVEAVWICAHGWRELAEQHRRWLTLVKVWVWRRRCRGARLARALGEFQAYRRAGSSVPAVEGMGSGGRVAGAPLLARVVQFLVGRLGRTEEEALDYPLGLAYWHFAAYQEAQGNLKILNADEVEFLEWCEAQDRAAAGKKEVARDA